MSLRDVLTAIALECDRQDRLKAEGRFAHHCGDPEMSDSERYLVLAEEVGEVARAILELGALANDHHGAGTESELRKELIQVAAVCAKWVEGMNRRAALRHVAVDGGGSRGPAPALDGEGVDQGREQRPEHASDDAEAGARGLLERDEDDDADQRREGEDGDDEDAE